VKAKGKRKKKKVVSRLPLTPRPPLPEGEGEKSDRLKSKVGAVSSQQSAVSSQQSAVSKKTKD